MSYPSARRQRRTPLERARLLAEYEQSELTQKEFAARNGLGVSCLSLWLRKSREAGDGVAPPPAFLRLPMELPAREHSGPAYKIGLPGGHSVELRAGFQIDELKRICQLLRSL